MTREEAIKTLRELWRETNDPWYEEVYNMAIEALKAKTLSRETYHNLVMASNDIDRALREYQDKEENGELVSAVRCRDCKWYGHIGCAIEIKDDSDRPKPDDFCSFGERRTK